MTLRAYIWGMSIVTFLSIAALGVVIGFVDPDVSGRIGKALFFLIVFFALSGVFNLLLLRFRKRMIVDTSAHDTIALSFRQGMLLSLFTCGILFLQGMRILAWWDALILLGGIFLIEVYFVSRN